METAAILDFETTGLSPANGDRPTEVAVAIVERGRIVDRFQSLMNPGRRIPSRVTEITGITNAMVRDAPPVADVMRKAVRYLGSLPVVAHNASFDRRFWEAELQRLSVRRSHSFTCTLLLARRLYPRSPNHKLLTLMHHLGLPAARAHRAMADVEMTVHLWRRITRDMSHEYGLRSITCELLARVQSTPRHQLSAVMRRLS